MEITAAVAHEPNGPFTIETLLLDDPRPGEVLVEIASVGICHTDLATRDGAIPFPMPAVLGHEGAGTVLAVGEGVTKVRPGDKVALTFNYCGRCRNCRKGEPAYCYEFLPMNYAGVRLDGSSPITAPDGSPVGSRFFGQSSFASHALPSELNVVKLPDSADLLLVGPPTWWTRAPGRWPSRSGRSPTRRTSCWWVHPRAVLRTWSGAAAWSRFGAGVGQAGCSAARSAARERSNASRAAGTTVVNSV